MIRQAPKNQSANMEQMMSAQQLHLTNNGIPDDFKNIVSGFKFLVEIALDEPSKGKKESATHQRVVSTTLETPDEYIGRLQGTPNATRLELVQAARQIGLIRSDTWDLLTRTVEEWNEHVQSGTATLQIAQEVVKRIFDLAGNATVPEALAE